MSWDQSLMVPGVDASQNSGDILTDLEAHWKFSGDFYDETANNNEGAAVGSAVAIGALHLDGVDDGMDVGDTASLSLTGSYTIAAWIKTSTGAGAIVAKGNTSAYNLKIENTGVLSSWCGGVSQTERAMSTGTVNTGAWVHVAVVVDVEVTGYHKFYINGSLDSTDTIAGNPAPEDTTETLNVGYDSTDSTYFNGFLHDVRIYSRALSAADILLLADTDVPPFIATFTGANGTTLNGLAPDSGPNNFVTRTGSWTIQSNRASCGTAGIVTNNLAITDYVITATVRSTSGAGVGIIVRYDTSNSYFYLINVEISSNRFRIYRYDGSFTQLQSATVTLNTSTDHTVVVTVSGTTITATVNGGNQIQQTGATQNSTATHIGIRSDTGGSVATVDPMFVPL